MTTFSKTTTINAPIEDVWAALAEVGDIHEWNPGVHHSYVTTEETAGLGAARHCDLGGRNYLKEEVVEFDEGQRITMRIVETNLPFETADIRFHLVDQGGATNVTVAPEYELKYGPLGSLLDAVYVRKTYEKGMAALLRGLKRHVEEQASLELLEDQHYSDGDQ